MRVIFASELECIRTHKIAETLLAVKTCLLLYHHVINKDKTNPKGKEKQTRLFDEN